MKNIPLWDKESYMKSLIAKTESFLKRMRWRIFFYKGSVEETERQEFYGFKSDRCPPSDPDLDKFELDVMLMVKNIKFDH